jgi:hypothetical protein
VLVIPTTRTRVEAGHTPHATPSLQEQLSAASFSTSNSGLASVLLLCCAVLAGWRPARVAVQVQGDLNSASGSTSWTVEMALPWSLLQQAANRQVPPAHGEPGPLGARTCAERAHYPLLLRKQHSGHTKYAWQSAGPSVSRAAAAEWCPHWQCGQQLPVPQVNRCFS